MILGILTLITALSISAVAIYYSVAGLVAIFAAATIPIIIMGSVLEIAKLVTAVWLHRYWKQAVWWLKGYLTVSVIVLMFITSMGIFGFLSKAHIDQTSNAAENVARLEFIDVELAKQNDVISKAETEIEKIENSGVNNDATIQAQIDREQVRIDSAYERIQPAIDEQNTIISKEEQRLGGSVTLYQEQITTIDRNLKSIEANIASGKIEAVQALVGVKADGNLGPATERAIEAYRIAQTTERQRLTELIATESKAITSPVIDAARAEIQRLRSVAEQQIQESNTLINRLRSQLGTANVDESKKLISEQEVIISKAREEVEKLTGEKYTLEAEYRKLEAEVGPIKYLAEFVYGNAANGDLLEEAVRWVIITIIFVFDPLAVLLLIASQYTFEIRKQEIAARKTENEKAATIPLEYPGTPAEPAIVKSRAKNTRPRNNSRKAKTDDQLPGTGLEERDRELERAKELEEVELSDSFKIAKIKWKNENPDKTIKEVKDAYIKGKIEELPWERYVQNAEQGDNSIWNRIRNRNE